MAQSPPPQASTQESKVVNAAPPEQETQSKALSLEHDYSDDDVTFDDFSKKDDGENLDEELGRSRHADKPHDQREEKKQVVSNQMDKNNEKPSNEFDSGINNQVLRTPSSESWCVHRNRIEIAG